MRIIKLLFVLSFFYLNITFAQEVEHNYLVGPQVTNCDSLDITGLSLHESIEKIRASKFRFDQSFKLTRKQGLQSGEYYSCDNERGYLVITFDGIESLYVNIEKDTWNDLISSSDPEGLYFKMKKKHEYEH